MQNSMLPVEILDRIVQFSYQQELLVLSRTSRQLQPLAETRIYEAVLLRDNNAAFRACQALAARDFVRCSYVKRFYFWQDQRFCQRGPMPEPFWRLIQTVLTKTVNLENLYMYDDSFSNTWIFQAQLPFQLTEAWLNFRWDDKLVTFLERQDRLKVLYLTSGPYDEEVSHRAPQSGSLPALETVEAPMHVTFDLLACSTLRLSFMIDDDNALLFSNFLEAMASTNKTLRSLHVIAVPEFLATDTLRILGSSTLATTLRHLGVLSLPLGEHDTQRHQLHRSLLSFSRLETLQVDVAHWQNGAMMPHAHRLLATELRTYCPTLVRIVFWQGVSETVWRFDEDNGQWKGQQVPGPRYAQREHLWRDV
ncbi:uncharacterized protein PHACADRAFT_33425 [Phanerochaete carnosa HHB-10118-sp]|uniref:F-box domain-containing protein n=1 Tax=Phanerochaete carnosa (strain HHB-10118-sp) TaxID=650164 RepID=K5UJZ6_PHACS|nr:uncharacterized protein PHACADRAFT_33425 [Phanerochaete carnosa HHB-10118-sp]EKM49891.1 hypothetical protein PHACADRAFT_33425 [Phanerochaete carnosa HHB-10118-sp]